MIYKVVPGPQVVTIKDHNYQSACDLFANIMNAEAAGGWKYCGMETITTQETTGCISKATVNRSMYMLIFAREE